MDDPSQRADYLFECVRFVVVEDRAKRIIARITFQALQTRVRFDLQRCHAIRENRLEYEATPVPHSFRDHCAFETLLAAFVLITVAVLLPGLTVAAIATPVAERRSDLVFVMTMRRLFEAVHA